MSLVYVMHLCRRYMAVLLLGVIVGAAVGWLMAARPSSFDATASLLIRPRSEADLRLYASTPERFVRSQARIAASDVVLDKAESDLPSGRQNRTLSRDVTVVGGESDDIIQVTVRGVTSASAVAAASAVATSFSETTTASTVLLGIEDVTEVRPLAVTIALGALSGAGASLILVLVIGAVRGPVFSPNQLAQEFPGHVFPILLSRKVSKQQQRDYRLLLIDLLGGADNVSVVVVGEGELVERVERAISSISKEVGRSVRLRDPLNPDPQRTDSTAVLVCASVGAPRRHIEQTLAAAEAVAGRRLLALEGR